MKTIEEQFGELCLLLTSGPEAEDVFGKCLDEDELNKSFRKLTAIIHPDKWAARKDFSEKAGQHFPLLLEFKSIADKKFSNKTYGVKGAADFAELSTKKNTYKIIKSISEGDLTNVFLATNKDNLQVILKISKSSDNFDLLAAEKSILSYVYEKLEVKREKALKHISAPVLESFEFTNNSENKRVNVLSYFDNCHTVEQIIEKHPNGIDVRDAAWMINRMLVSLIALKEAGVVHGAVVPNNCLLDLDNHNGFLIDYCFSVKENEKMKAVSSKYRHFYPEEVFQKQTVNSGLDLFMLGKTFLYLIGGASMNVPKTTTKSILNLFSACFLGKSHRYSDPLEFYKDFREAQTKAFGPSTFRQFKL